MLLREGDAVRADIFFHEDCSGIVELRKCFVNGSKSIFGDDITAHEIAKVQESSNCANHIARYEAVYCRNVDLKICSGRVVSYQ